jgi:hypothetical protein
MLRTLDWMSDKCEAKLRGQDRPPGGVVTYRAIMSPIRVKISQRGRRTRRAKWPVTVLITDRWLIVATKRRIVRRAKVHKFDCAAITVAAEQNTLMKRPGFEFLTEEELEVFTGLLPNVSAAQGTRFASA